MFLKVVDTGSFQATAKEVDYAQAGVSYIINTVEEMIGMKLFLRIHEGVRRRTSLLYSAD